VAIIHLEGWLFEVDQDTTATIYQKLISPSEECGCTYCRNFVAASKHLPEIVVDLLNKFGIEARKPTNVSEVCTNCDGTHLYIGFYHAIASIIRKPMLVEEQLELDGVSLSFSKRSDLVADNLHEPILPLEFTCNLPWVLDEAPESG
jgi:hypothetical protein